MPYQVGITVTISPGSEFRFEPAIAPTRRSLIIVGAPTAPIGRVLAYADVLIGAFLTPSGVALGRVRSVPITRIGAFIDGCPESSSFGGYFIRIYAVNHSNEIPRAYSLALEVP